MTPRDELAAVRADPGRRRALAFVGMAGGLALASLHWLGLVVGGAAVALVQPDLRRGVAAGVAFGAVAVVAFGAVLAVRGALGPVLGMGPLPVVAAGSGLALAALGSLARGLV